MLFCFVFHFKKAIKLWPRHYKAHNNFAVLLHKFHEYDEVILGAFARSSEFVWVCCSAKLWVHFWCWMKHAFLCFKCLQAEKHYKLATSETGYGLGLKNYGCPHRQQLFLYSLSLHKYHSVRDHWIWMFRSPSDCTLLIPSCLHGTSPQRHTQSHQIIQTIRESPLLCLKILRWHKAFVHVLVEISLLNIICCLSIPPSKLECKEEALNADTHYRLAICLDKNYKDEAIVHYRKAMEINPKFVDAYLRLANLIDKGFYFWITTSVLVCVLLFFLTLS